MKQKQDGERNRPWHRKPTFGSLYTMKGSRYIYISLNYFKQRLRFPTDKEDTPQNWNELCEFMGDVGRKIKNGTFVFAKAFYWLDDATKAHFTQLEGGDYKPVPEHVFYGEYATAWMERKIPTFGSVTKQRYYAGALQSRILPYFDKMPFSSITGSVVESFIDNLKRCNAADKNLSVRRIKNIIGPMRKTWKSACKDYNWTINDPFSDLSEKYKELEDKELLKKERQAALQEEQPAKKREVFLLSEWEILRQAIDPHYHVVLELLLRGLIGSELEALQKRYVDEQFLQVRCSIVREKGGKAHLKFKPKNWYRKREIPLTAKLKALIAQASLSSNSSKIRRFEDGIELPESAFLLTMKDGGPFNYESFRKTVWDKAVRDVGLDGRIPYSLRHTFVQWALLIGVDKNRLVDLMGHSTKKMVDEVYGFYRKGLIDERQQILDYLGEDFLAKEELRVAFPERCRQTMALPDIPPEIAEAPVLAIAFGQSFGQSQGLYADNYLK